MNFLLGVISFIVAMIFGLLLVIISLLGLPFYLVGYLIGKLVGLLTDWFLATFLYATKNFISEK